MNQQDPMQDAPEQVPRRTTPTWEMELLLSGATVFALFQAANAVLGWGGYLMPRLDNNVRAITSVLITYGHGALILLVLAFALHLILRAYWVALVGMNSVFPGGLRIDRVRAGPVAKALLLLRWQDIDASIERADNRATIVFGIGVSVALVLVPVSLAVIGMFLISTVIAWLIGDPKATTWLMGVVMAIWFTPLAIATLADRYRGEKMVPGSLEYRACMATLGVYSKAGMGRDANPLVTLFSSNVGERRGTGIVLTVMMLAMGLSGASMIMSRNDLGTGSYGSFPDTRRGMPASVEGRNYASSHDRGFSPSAPFVPDMVSKGDYLKLVVPYVPSQYGYLLKTCKGADAGEDTVDAERARREHQLDCLHAGLAVAVDGQPIDFKPEWYTEPGRDLRGLLYMLPVRGLADGRHVVSVLPTPETPPVASEDPVQPYLIPFWR